MILSCAIISKTHSEINVLDYVFARSQLVQSILVDARGISGEESVSGAVFVKIRASALLKWW